MDYLKSLLESIRSEAELSGENHVCISLESIAKTWNQTILLGKCLRAELEKRNYMDDEFLKNVFLSLKNLENKNSIKVKSIILGGRSKKLKSLEEIVNFKSHEDKVCVDIKEGDDIINLYLTKAGDLYREPKEKYCYPMSASGDGHKILRFLAENTRYQLTGFISLELNMGNKKYIRTTIGKTNNIIKGKLEIGGNLIQGRKGSGYRINPKYKIVFKDE